MTNVVEEAVSMLSTFSLEDDQPDIQGLTVTLLNSRNVSESPLDFEDVAAYQLLLTEDAKSINQLNTLIQEGREMVAILYTYRSCVKALPQLPDSMKQNQADLYLETYQVLDLEIGRLRDIQRWQGAAATKLAGDMQRFCRPERRINGPTVAHMWCMLKLLDVLLQLDHLKNAKASIPNDFSWYKRTFTQVSTQWPDTDSMREELDDLQIFLSTRWAILLNIQVELFRVNNVEDLLQILMLFCLESLESDRILLYSDRHALLRVLPVLVVLMTSSEKEGDLAFRKIKVNRLIRVFRRDPVIPAFPDLHLSPASMLKELSPYFRKVTTQNRFTSLPTPHELLPREASDLTSFKYQREYLIVHHIPAIRFSHDEFCLRFAAAVNQLQLLKTAKVADDSSSMQVKEDVYLAVLEGFQLLSEWTGRIWEQCAWKFSRPSKDVSPYDDDVSTTITDYEKVVRCNYSAEERKAMVILTSYIKGVGTMLEHVDTLVADTIWEVIHAQVQDFVQNKIANMLRTTLKKKKDVARILTDMRTIASDWMGNASKFDAEHSSSKRNKDESEAVTFLPRPAAPSATQIHCLQYLIHELISNSAPKKVVGFFGSNDTEIPSGDLKQLEVFFNRLTFFPYILDFRATLCHVTDLGFLWFREFYLETSRVIQFPIECSLPWMLVDHIIESQDTALLESVLMPFDIYNDSAEHSLRLLRQRFLYDEIEAEVDLCFDQLVFKLSEHMFAHFKSHAASKFLDKAFLAAVENSDKFQVSPKRYDGLLQMRRVQLLGRNIDLAFLIGQRMNKIFRENLDFLLESFEARDLCSIVEDFGLLISELMLFRRVVQQDHFKIQYTQLKQVTTASYSEVLFLELLAGLLGSITSRSSMPCYQVLMEQMLLSLIEIFLQELHQLVEILRSTHELLAQHLKMDAFNLMLGEMMENISMVSFSSRLASQIFSEIQNDLLPNFVICNTTQRFVRSTKSSQNAVRRPPPPPSKLSFLCGTQDLNLAHAVFAELYSKFFGLPHMLAVIKLLGPRSIPWLLRALLDYLSQKVTSSLDSGICDLRGALPKAINIPPPEAGVLGCLKVFREQMHWVSGYEGKIELFQCLKDIGGLIFWISLLDTAMKELETVQFMQVAPWMGVVPTGDGQLQQLLSDSGASPLVDMFKKATHAVLTHPACLCPSAFVAMAKQAEIADSMYSKNLQTGSILDYTFSYLSAILDSVRVKWNFPSKTGLMEITTSREYHRIYSGIQFVFCSESFEDQGTNYDRYGDAIAWGGCTIMYLLGQHLRFELLDFLYHLLNVAEAEAVSTAQLGLQEKPKQPAVLYSQEVEDLLETAKKTRRLNNHIFSILRARYPQEEKSASMIKQSGTVVQRVKYPNLPSPFDSLPLKGSTGLINIHSGGAPVPS